jgi:oligopeptide/dipeptide ABC transporter ATP-binding protein
MHALSQSGFYTAGTGAGPILAARGVKVAFSSEYGMVNAVRDVSFDLQSGTALGLVGESGCGKTTVALAVMGLLPSNARVLGGSALIDAINLLSVPAPVVRRMRGRRIAMVFQDSMTSLNPLLTVGRQITEVLERHHGMTHRQAKDRAAELLTEVGVPEPRQRLDQFPHQLSGGLRQRVAISVALSPDPAVLIADEPTTALDVTIQAQLLDLLRQEIDQRRMALLLITHDLGVVSRICEEVAVMYVGRIVEHGSTAEVFADPRHPYMLGLLESVPRIEGEILGRLPQIAGSPPPLWALPPGCSFNLRCPFVIDKCLSEDPPLLPVETADAGREIACWVDVTQGKPA